MYVDECPINDDYKQQVIDSMTPAVKMEYDRQERAMADATEAYLEEFEATGSVDFAKYVYFRHLSLYL